jgi:hypothetical protein
MRARLLVGEKPRVLVCPLCGLKIAQRREAIQRTILDHVQRWHGKLKVHPT